MDNPASQHISETTGRLMSPLLDRTMESTKAVAPQPGALILDQVVRDCLEDGV